MSRPLRIEFAGGLYHVASRGDGREAIFLGKADRRLFLGVLAEVVSNCNWAAHAYCLMDNHYHLLIETPDGNLSTGMRHLNGVYTQRFNRQHGRVGHVFQGPYKAIIVQKESYLLREKKDAGAVLSRNEGREMHGHRVVIVGNQDPAITSRNRQYFRVW